MLLENRAQNPATLMLYVQHIRNRKEPLVPKTTDDMIEVLGVVGGNFSDLIAMEPDRFVEVTTSSRRGSIDGDDSSPGARPRKRAKLDHLSVDEKAQHRKMMNRISAQSARDRQKAMMQQQEVVIKALTTSNEGLKKENNVLTGKVEKLSDENDRLSSLLREYEEKFQKHSLSTESIKKVEIKTEVMESLSTCTLETDSKESFNNSLEPAVPRTVPLPKGPEMLKNLSFILLLWTCYQWIWTHQNLSKPLKTSLNKSSVQEINSHQDLKKLLLQNPILLKWIRNMKQLDAIKIKDPD